jgi:hypothetical protein
MTVDDLMQQIKETERLIAVYRNANEVVVGTQDEVYSRRGLINRTSFTAAVSLVAPRPGEGLLTEGTPAVRPRPRDASSCPKAGQRQQLAPNYHLVIGSLYSPSL